MSEAIYPSAVRGLTWTVMRQVKFSTLIQTGVNGYELRIPQWQNPKWEYSLIYEFLFDNPLNTLASLAPYTDYQTLLGFVLARQCDYDDFLFDDPDDDTIGPAVWKPFTYFAAGQTIIDPNAHLQTAQVNGITAGTAPTFSTGGGTVIDGSELWKDGGAFNGANAQPLPLVTNGAGAYYTPIQRTMAGQFSEDIPDLNLGLYTTFRLWADGVLQTLTTDYVFSDTPGLSVPGASYMGAYVTWVTEPTPPITGAGMFYQRLRFDGPTQDFEKFLNQYWTVGGQDSKNGKGYLQMVTSRPTIST
jgi:hypothetical protein